MLTWGHFVTTKMTWPFSEWLVVGFFFWFGFGLFCFVFATPRGLWDVPQLGIEPGPQNQPLGHQGIPNWCFFTEDTNLALFESSCLLGNHCKDTQSLNCSCFLTAFNPDLVPTSLIPPQNQGKSPHLRTHTEDVLRISSPNCLLVK